MSDKEEEYETTFNVLKQQYIEISKEYYTELEKIKKISDNRDAILEKIRNLQIEFNQITKSFSFEDFNEITYDKDTNLIDKYKN